jgi:hypothetical protein
VHRQNETRAAGAPSLLRLGWQCAPLNQALPLEAPGTSGKKMCALHNEGKGMVHEDSVGPKWSCLFVFAKTRANSKVERTLRQPRVGKIMLNSRTILDPTPKPPKPEQPVPQPPRPEIPPRDPTSPGPPSPNPDLPPIPPGTTAPRGHPEPSLGAGGLLPLSQPPFAGPCVPSCEPQRSRRDAALRGRAFERCSSPAWRAPRAKQNCGFPGAERRNLRVNALLRSS